VAGANCTYASILAVQLPYVLRSRKLWHMSTLLWRSGWSARPCHWFAGCRVWSVCVWYRASYTPFRKRWICSRRHCRSSPV